MVAGIAVGIAAGGIAVGDMGMEMPGLHVLGHRDLVGSPGWEELAASHLEKA